MKPQAECTVWTIGHSTRPLEELIALLRAHGVEHVVDVRTVPRSRRNPQFEGDTLARSLGDAGIRYTHARGLGGFRRPTPDSPNRGWRNESFRGYADYMQTTEFAQHFAYLLELARQERVALMCAEAVPWRCHRSLIADALVVHGLRVEEIVSGSDCRVHALTPFARVRGTTITYPVSTAEPGNQTD